ncbi:hypothetical protein F4820DRAFT_447256 [Hypoxylon rubiginosum]|uniref:Uncharacterized protein n=1 Tax=Hypoxylon rubiginosum TaxID=110542 RepID=A0ACB9Z3S9_9PEZI|nr:hypothetical protein F4820DRAFT_447256 [Hypoxylon rubiginosum]
MASRNHHLDATTSREVVYCHHCEHEWYRDERPTTLDCPRCHSEITEIVSPNNDPRNLSDNDSLPDYEDRHRHARDSDDDPDEDDIEQHILQGPGGFFSRRAIYQSPDRQASNGPRAAPDNADQIFRRFTELIGDLGGPAMVGRSGPDTLFSNPPPRVTVQRFSGPGFTAGVSSFTITTGPGRNRPDPSRSPGPGMGPDDPFQRMFGNIIGEMGPPIDHGGPRSPNQNEGDGNARQNADFSMALSQLIASLINPHMVHGDAVYSQEALDRIITNLMEANPQSNAPAPASDEAIAKLPKKKLDEEMLGPELKGECTICIDDMKVGDEAVVLPCKHWFHEQCVVLWLKQHNTCPICRAAIDGDAAGRPSGAAPASQSSPSDLPSPFRRPSIPGYFRNVQAGSSGRQEPLFRRDSNSPPMNPRSSQQTRVRSPSPSSRRSAQSERARDGRGSSGSGPFNWIRDQFRDRRS